MLVGILQDCRDRPVAPFIKHHVWYANVIRTRRGEERVAERDLNLFAPSRFRGGGGLHLHKSVQGPVVKNVTFRNVGKNPTNLGKLHYEYSPET